MIDKSILKEVIASNERAIVERSTMIIPRSGISIPKELDKTIVMLIPLTQVCHEIKGNMVSLALAKRSRFGT